MTIEELLDREEIRLLQARYNINGDRGLVDALAETFAEDGAIDFNGERTTGRAAIAARLGSGVGRPGGTTVMRHHLGQQWLEIDGDSAKGRTYFAMLNDIGVDHHGVYVDTMVRTPEGWRFALREVRIDWQTPETLSPPMNVRGRKPAD